MLLFLSTKLWNIYVCASIFALTSLRLPVWSLLHLFQRDGAHNHDKNGLDSLRTFFPQSRLLFY